MAEEITYIPYGLDEISQLDLMTNLANGVNGYLDSLRWGKKDKYRQAWIKAYQDIMNRGIVGASNDTGIWQLKHKGDPITLDNMSNVDREMYQDAAYYIQLQMSKMTPRKKEEEKKDNLTTFDFVDSFNKSLLNNYYGGNASLFEDPEQGWASLDARGDNGLRATTNRRAQMIKALEEYSKGLEEGKYNFEGTSFKDLGDAKARIQAAVDALKNTPEDTSDDIPAFNALGLNYRAYFSNGGNDASTHYDENGNPYTWNLWNESEKARLDKEAKDKAEAEKKKLAQLRANQYKRFRFHTGTGATAEQLSKYQDVLGQLNKYGTGLSLTLELKNELVGAFQIAGQNGQLVNLSKEELLRFGSGYINNPGRLKKINGLNGFYWDTVGNRVILPFMETTTPQTFLDIINANNPEVKQQQYLNLEGAEYAELGAIAADIASIIDPEPFSAMGLSLGAAGARNYAKLQLPGKWNWKDYGSQALDYITSVVGAVPVVGDTVLAGKVIKNLRRLGRFGAWSDMLQSAPGLKDIWDKKIMGDEKMTIQDWRTVGTALRGLVSHGRMNQSNLAARKVMELRGVSVDPGEVKGIKANVNKWAQKTGFTRTTPAETVTTKSSIKIKDENGKVIDVPISEKVKQDLEKSFKGKSNAEKLEAVKANKDVQEAAKGKIDLSKATGLDATKDARNLQGVRRFVGTNRGIFGKQTTTSEATRGVDNFDNYLKNRGIWSKIGLGSNSYLRRIDRQLNLNSNQITSQDNKPDKNKIKGYLENLNTKKPKQTQNSSETPSTQKETNNIITPPKINNTKSLPTSGNITKNREMFSAGNRPANNYSIRQNQKEINNFIDSYGLNSKRGNRPTAGGYDPNRKLDDGVYRSGDIVFDKKNGKISVTFGKLKKEFTNLASARRYLAESINNSELKKNDISKTAEVLRELKRLGIFKQGGLVSPLDKIIEDFFVNNNI